MGETDDRRRALADSAAALTAEVKALTGRIDGSNERLDQLTERNKVLGERARRHSWWIFGTVAGLVLDLVLTVAMFTLFDTQQRAVRQQCGFLALIVGSYRPESRPPDARPEYERSFTLIREQYDDLRCASVVPIVPPAGPR